MSVWLRMINEMKQRSPQDYFTPSQQTVYEKLVERLQFPHQRLNLFGPPGTGKTFIAWGLVRALDAVHVPVPSRLRQFDGQPMSILILDNAPTYEDEERNLLAEAALMDAESVVFITQRPTTLQMRRLQIDLPSDDDYRHIARTLGRLGFYEVSAPPPTANLWQILQCYV